MQALKKPAVWIYSLLAVGLWAFFAFAMPDVLEFWEKNQLFRFTSEYWHFFDHEPFGTLIYLHTFLIQFSYYPWLGAIVYALLFTLTAWLFNRCFMVNGNRRLLPGLVTVALLLPTTVNFGLLILLIPLVATILAPLWMDWKNLFVKYLCQALILGGMVYLFHEYAIWICLFYICIDFYRTTKSKNKFNFYWLLPAILSVFLFIVLTNIVYKPYPFILNNHLFSGNFFTHTNMIPYGYFRPRKMFFFCMGGFVLESLLFTFLYTNNRNFDYIIGLLAIVGSSYFTTIHAQPMATFQKVDRLSRSYMWDEALQTLNAHWKKNPNISNIDNPKRLLLTQTKVALLATRKASSQLFTYPQPAFPLLFPLSISNSAECVVLPTYYTFVGGISESLHMNYDLITCHNISANVLNATIINSLIISDTAPALKLSFLLESSLFYRSQSIIYKNPLLRNTLTAVERGKRMLPSRNFSIGSYEPDKNTIHRHYYQPENPYFYEYFLCVCLLNKMHILIEDEIPNIKKFYHKGGPFFAPRHIQEALLASFDYLPSCYLYPQKIEGVSNEVWNDYWHFIADNLSYTNKKITFSEMQKKWRHTYWFYDCYLKPLNINSEPQSIN
ncbi:MAG: DUF6057 family protein [Bacteroides sp.]|nr:DUF6057 family protein [Bacteroides sp.]MCM1085893.1 DUF6057 family protein [Bacteroides sp.]